MNCVYEAGLGVDCRNARRPGFRVECGFQLEIGNLLERISMTAGREGKSLRDAQLEQAAGRAGAGARAGG